MGQLLIDAKEEVVARGGHDEASCDVLCRVTAQKANKLTSAVPDPDTNQLMMYCVVRRGEPKDDLSPIVRLLNLLFSVFSECVRDRLPASFQCNTEMTKMC